MKTARMQTACHQKAQGLLLLHALLLRVAVAQTLGPVLHPPPSVTNWQTSKLPTLCEIHLELLQMVF